MMNLRPLNLTPKEQTKVVDTAKEAYADFYRLLTLVAVFVSFGLIMLYSTSFGIKGAYYFKMQLCWVTIGASAGLFLFILGYQRVLKTALFFLVTCFILLIIARFCYPPIKGAYRWIKLPFCNLQPSEFCKLAVAFFVAKYCSENMRTLSCFFHKKGIIPLAIGLGMGCGGIILGKDFGTTLLVGVVACSTLFIAGIKLRYALVPLVCLALGVLYIVCKDAERLSRMVTFLNPEVVAKEEGYQLFNSLMALGSGSWWGIGFTASRMKAKYLPEAHTDFIVAIVGEELGFVVIILIIIFYGLFFYLGYKIASYSKTKAGTFLAFALTLGIYLQSCINLLVVSGAAPTKGMPAPFLSYGGSNMVASLMAVGIICSVAYDEVEPGYSDNVINWIFNKIAFLGRIFSKQSH